MKFHDIYIRLTLQNILEHAAQFLLKVTTGKQMKHLDKNALPQEKDISSSKEEHHIYNKCITDLKLMQLLNVNHHGKLIKHNRTVLQL